MNGKNNTYNDALLTRGKGGFGPWARGQTAVLTLQGMRMSFGPEPSRHLGNRKHRQGDEDAGGADLPGPVQALIPSRSTQHHFTLADQVDQLVTASETTPDLGFMARLLALCSLPRSNPGNQYQYQRVNGPYKLILSRTGLHKLPHGSNPRLILAWISTEAVRTGSREIVLGRSLSEFMRKLGISSTDGRGQARLRNQMKRLFNCSVQLNYTAGERETSATALVAELTDFWWNPKHPDQTGLWESKVRLSEAFFNEIINHPVPLDMNTLKALKRSPLGLDLYLWLVYRTFPLRAPLRLSWRLLYSQFGVNPDRASDKFTVRNFRRWR